MARITAADRRRIRRSTVERLHASGWSNRHIARELKVTEGTVRNDVAALGLRNQGAQITHPEPEIAHADYARNSDTATNIVPLRRVVNG